MTECYLSPMIKLTSTNYSLWKSMMEDFLNCKDLYDLIKGDNANTSDMLDSNWKKWTLVSTSMLPKRQIPTLFGRTWKTCMRQRMHKQIFFFYAEVDEFEA